MGRPSSSVTEEEAAYAKGYFDLAEQVRDVLPYCFRLSQMQRSDFTLEDHSSLVRLQMAVDPDRMEMRFHRAEREWRWLQQIVVRAEQVASDLRFHFVGRATEREWRYRMRILVLDDVIRDYKKERDANG